jgi:hypothetical protein
MREIHSEREEAAFWESATAAVLCGVPTRAMSAEDQVFHICVHEARWCPSPLPRWMADVSVVLGETGRAFDTARLVERARRLELVTPVKEALECLAATVPDIVPLELLRALREVPPTRRDAHEYAVRCRRSGALGILRDEYVIYRDTTCGQSAVRRWLGFPRYLQALWGLGRPWQVAAHAVAWSWRAVRTDKAGSGGRSHRRRN